MKSRKKVEKYGHCAALNYFLICVLCVSVLACGKKKKSADAPAKPLFSVWTDKDDGQVMDLTTFKLGETKAVGLTQTDGSVCACNMQFVGTESAGAYVLNICSYAGGGGGDPGCVSLDQAGNYTKSASELKICDGSDCSTYR